MKLEYFTDTGTLSIPLTENPGEVEAEDTSDPDVTLLYDTGNRVAEIVIKHARQRVDLASIRRRIGFLIVGDRESMALSFHARIHNDLPCRAPCARGVAGPDGKWSVDRVSRTPARCSARTGVG